MENAPCKNCEKDTQDATVSARKITRRKRLQEEN